MAAYCKLKMEKAELANLHPIVTALFQQRRQFLYTDPALTAYLLDPRFNGEHLTLEERQRASRFLFCQVPSLAHEELIAFMSSGP
jgi:hypothetical protein